MNPISIRFRCPCCNARIKASPQLSGQRRPCPRCGRSLVVRRSIPRDVEPVLVLMDGEDRCALGLTYRRGA